MIPEGFPPGALAIVNTVAEAHGCAPQDIFKPWPRPTWIDDARIEAIGRLANEQRPDGRRLYQLSNLSAWFDVRRERVSIYAMRWPGYKSRRLDITKRSKVNKKRETAEFKKWLKAQDGCGKRPDG